MMHFSKRFPELGPQETRTAFFPERRIIPRGQVRVSRTVLRRGRLRLPSRAPSGRRGVDPPAKIWATISFGWDPDAEHAEHG